MMMCKQAEQGVPLQAEQTDWLADTDEEIDEQELEAHYSFMAKIQEVLPGESSSTEQLMEQKANASLTQELKEFKTNLAETGRALGEATSCRDSCLIALQKDLNETLGLLARKDIDIKEGLKTKAYEISVVNQKHDELVKKSLLTKSQFEGQLKEKSKVISDLKVKEGRDIDKMIEMDKQIKFLNEILYKRNQSIQTIHMLAPKCATYNGRSTFANPKWIPIGKLFNSFTSKVESEPIHGSNVDIHHIHACKQTLGLSACTSVNGQKQQRIDLIADALYNAKQENLRVWTHSSMFRRRLIVADQASVFMAMTSVHISSGLVLHQMTSDHNRSELGSELGIQDHSNER
ncbi:hypothetical protein Tco_0801136 [Tanacetum coccineum]|uniref:Uncharacterized protein n=1 Tax=Tanacetum coccineum TaxID=301880 RepID=A0ABQ4ZV80_9ASTR